MKQLLFFCALGFMLTSFTNDTYVTFTLRNESLSSIPLKIPGVMNPNLSPMSNSGVSLKIGQEVFFFHKGRKQLLLVVGEELEGEKILVNRLIKERKAALGLK